MLIKFSSCVVVYAANTPGEPDCERIVLRVRPKQAEAMLHSGQAEIFTRHRKVIRVMRLTGKLIDVRKLGLNPGSFGIRRETTAYGKVYAHNSAWGQLARPATRSAERRPLGLSRPGR